MVESLKNDEVKKFVVQINGGQKIIEVVNIIVIEASESCSMIICADNQKFICRQNLNYFEKLLLKNKNLIRIHKSWIVNTNYLQS